ncbi:hypothetical protein LCGC14_2104550 [marine sediment metagenome]|uniref:Uncharacterized protein n=1 Tax=marine sediment metagenome TaxID=412755 RepID=A0A0F9EW55_9ZZZZ
MALATNALTTVAKVKIELGIAVLDTSQDSILEQYINVVSPAIEVYLNRPLAFVASVVELLRGPGDTSIFVSRTPVVTINSILVRTSALDATEFDLLTIEGFDNVGEIFRETGWPWSVQLGGGITSDPVPGSERKDITVDYDGGYILPKDAGAPPAGSSFSLPADLEQAAIDAVVNRFRNKGVDQSIVAEGLMSANVKYDRGAANRDAGSELPDLVQKALDKHKRWFD